MNIIQQPTKKELNKNKATHDFNTHNYYMRKGWMCPYCNVGSKVVVKPKSDWERLQ